MSEARIYGVSTGNGNDGVSHLFANYYVKTDQPYRLAELATLTEFKKGEGQAWAKENVEIDGEAEFTISAVIRESLETQEERATMQDRLDQISELLENDSLDRGGESTEELEAEAEQLENEIENYGMDYAWFILEVFPEDEPRDGVMVYDSLEEAFGDDVALVPAEA